MTHNWLESTGSPRREATQAAKTKLTKPEVLRKNRPKRARTTHLKDAVLSTTSSERQHGTAQTQRRARGMTKSHQNQHESPTNLTLTLML